MKVLALKCLIMRYRKRHKFSKRKVLVLLDFREKFHGFDSFVLKVLPLLKVFVGETFTVHQKSVKTAKLFSCVAFVFKGVLFSLLLGDGCFIRIVNKQQ